MKGKKVIFLLLALMLPILVFLFLKIFGKNEFRVAPLFVHTLSAVPEGCDVPTLPYHLPQETLNYIGLSSDSLALVLFGNVGDEEKIQLARVNDQFRNGLPFKEVHMPDSLSVQWRKCTFFLPDPLNVALVDRNGVIRGQYDLNDMEEMDRLLTEITIISKLY